MGDYFQVPDGIDFGLAGWLDAFCLTNWKELETSGFLQSIL
jgi:hypothetical protein